MITDDGDTVPKNRLQLITGMIYTSAESLRGWTLPVVPTLGLSDAWEAGVSFGYQWQKVEEAGEFETSDGVVDTLLTTKWKWTDQSRLGVTLSSRLTLKIPSAAPERALGTGKSDVGALMIATKSFGNTALDFNVGYTFLDAWGTGIGDDELFLAQDVRHRINDHWVLMAEVFGRIPVETKGGSTVSFNEGLQYFLNPNLDLETAVLTTIGGGDPTVSVYLGITCLF